MALDPNFPASPYVYVLYTYDAEIGGTAPRWGTPGADSDPCPTPPGPTSDGCLVSGRLSRLQASGNVMIGSEQVLIGDWCQQYPSHSIGTVEFGPGGALYASGGDGASFNFADYGQDGNPLNPCGDPPGGVGAVMTPPTAQGGALRCQDLPTSGDPVSLDGTVIRVDPATGAGLSGNPLFTSTDANARRIIAYGLRNPLRFTFRPGTSELWVGDVGWNDWEEINRIPTPTDTTADNFGWPCYEGNNRQAGYDGANLSICENLYAESARSPSRTTPTTTPARSSPPTLPDWQLLDRRAGVRVQLGRHLSRRVRRRPVLRRLLARLHLGDAQGRRRPPGSWADPAVRRGSGQPGQPGDGTGRQPLLP
jgi:hypothetical protein